MHGLFYPLLNGSFEISILFYLIIFQLLAVSRGTLKVLQNGA
jgi:hypothetical protein